MLRSVAISRINRGLGFRSISASTIESALLEAQRELEKGKTLPKFLLQEDQTLTLTAGVSYVALPSGFLRVYEENRPHYTPDGEETPVYLEQKLFSEARAAYVDSEDGGPQVYVIRKDTLLVYPVPDDDYTLTWDYYKAAALLTSDIENEWLANEPDWLIGEAGWRLAMDVRDQTAVQVFDSLRKTARASWLAEEIADEESVGPLYLGMNN